MNFIVPELLAQSILDKLTSLPYREVKAIIDALIACPTDAPVIPDGKIVTNSPGEEHA